MLRSIAGRAVRRAAAPRVAAAALSTAPKATPDAGEPLRGPLDSKDTFTRRHVGPDAGQIDHMLGMVGFSSQEELISSTVPAHIRLADEMELPDNAMSEMEALATIKAIAMKNQVKKSFLGQGYSETITPPVILRNILENPGWYTAYTPYQAEISQGRLEMLLNFQTMIAELCGMEMCGASLLDESSAAAESMAMCFGINKKRRKFFADKRVHPQTHGLLKTRSTAVGAELVIGDASALTPEELEQYAGVIVQYPDTLGSATTHADLADACHEAKALLVAAVDPMALAMLTPPGEWGADIVVGSAQRFGVPMGFGGPHAGFLATNQSYARRMPGRLIGVSVDAEGAPALRMAMQTREQHIRRDKATSNICTAQALLANMAAAYGIYHGPEGLKEIAGTCHAFACTAAAALRDHGFEVPTETYFDTITVNVGKSGMKASDVAAAAAALDVNVRVVDEATVGLAFGEGTTSADLSTLLQAFGVSLSQAEVEDLALEAPSPVAGDIERSTPILTHPVFSKHQSESQMMRYLRCLEAKDLGLNHSMISLGSCTMKLNATAEMMPITWPEFADIHPFAPVDQTTGYLELIDSLNKDLAIITGFAAVSTQPNAGATGEYAGLLAIKKYHEANGDTERNVCIIPLSAHGTNPASAAMAGMKVVTVKTLEGGDVDMEDMKEKVGKNKDKLAAFMITYPSTFGVFEEGIIEMCDLIHDNGGQVYMDGANMNAQVAITSPGLIGADVCHLNLHKTFCIPHGGGGPGVGSIGVAEHLAPHLPGHNVIPTGGEGRNVVAKEDGAIAGAPYGSALILPISWMYIKMLGSAGLLRATQAAILNANYMATRLEEEYIILFRGKNGQCAHEFIVDLRPFKHLGVSEEDVCKRLQDYGFHGPTQSWPVPGTLMIEPTESEDQAELDRFCDALIMIREEIREIESGEVAYADSALHNAPHTAKTVTAAAWDRPYSRQAAAFPAPWVANHKHWPTVSRIDNVHGDRNLICSCPPLSEYE